MNEPEIELDDIEALSAGAIGEPGARVFYLQARNSTNQLTVLVEKEQIALLATEALAFLDRLAEEYPEAPVALPEVVAELQEPTVPLFRARLIGLGFDPEREMVLIELREHPAPEDDDDLELEVEDGPITADDEEEGYVARIYATRPQVRAMAARGTTVVSAGRPPCSLCGMPMDPAGHRCPRWN
jgi:uncharacterized repeat protein (TIGR03847 family)